jgi:hypothetical protein
VLVGAVIAWLIASNIITAEQAAEVEAGLIVALTAVCQGVYYTVVRLLGRKWPKVEMLLGAKKAPSYPSGP